MLMLSLVCIICFICTYYNFIISFTTENREVQDTFLNPNLESHCLNNIDKYQQAELARWGGGGLAFDFSIVLFKF